MNRLISALCMVLGLIALALWLAAFAALPARAQDANCGPLVDVLAGLAANYAETSRVDALMAKKAAKARWG